MERNEPLRFEPAEVTKVRNVTISGGQVYTAPPLTMRERLLRWLPDGSEAILDAMLRELAEPDAAMLKAGFVAMNETPSGQWKRMKEEGVTARRLFDVKMAPRWRAMVQAIGRSKGETRERPVTIAGRSPPSGDAWPDGSECYNTDPKPGGPLGWRLEGGAWIVPPGWALPHSDSE